MSKEQERNELHSAIWLVAQELRGSVDGWDFKAYVLGTLFYRFLSENLTTYINRLEREAEDGDPNFDYAAFSDEDAEFGRDETVKEKGFYILPSQLFVNVWSAARDASEEERANLNETLANVFKSIENSAVGTASEEKLAGLFADVDVNSPKLGRSTLERGKKLFKILDAIAGLNLGDFTDNSIDAFGDAYEFLMTMYASDAGKSGGEFFTPQEVAELLAEITLVGKNEINKVYDPACGSGSLLLKFAKILKTNDMKFYGQEINLTTYNLCRFNMFLHNVGYENFHIAHGDTLLEPAYWDDEPFDAIVSNPPYSTKWEGDGNPILINDPRFAPAGVLAPKKYADLAFTMHILSWLSEKGTAAIVEYPGILYRGKAEQKIRRYLVENDYVDAVIQLPSNLFFGTTTATCIIVLKKSKTDASILFIDASQEFVHSENQNKLSDENRRDVLKLYADRADVEYRARLVRNDEVARNDFNLSVSRYVEQKDDREEVDIAKLNAEIAEIVARQEVLRREIDEIIAELNA